MKKTRYDYLIVGAGLYGAVCARELTDAGKRCLVIDKRNVVAGNIYTQEVEGIQVHVYGGHIFHTSNEAVWHYMNRFSDFNGFINTPIANYHGELYNLPFNMNTFYQMWGTKTPAEAQSYIYEQVSAAGITEPHNLEEQAISLVGQDIYEKLIKGYTEKQWGHPCKELPAFIIRRLPVRFTFNNNYFNDRFQGVPIGGYTSLVEKMLDGIEVRLNVDYFKNRDLDNVAGKIIYTGPIDRYFEYRYDPLEWRSLRFETKVLDIDDFQGVAAVNYTDSETPYTRIIEHKHFSFGKQTKTVITKEYSEPWTLEKEPYYPINNQTNMDRYTQYKKLASAQSRVYFGGRLAEYKYYDMHQIVEHALEFVKTVCKED
ncbi:MAG: UDP-galactopyranose mutase [Oscillospiraceae bacterium]|nr:UDP-galactopyranose mutase [Oscillospiraceae bacterium]